MGLKLQRPKGLFSAAEAAPSPGQRSMLPLGGCRQWDDEYERWRDRFVDAANQTWLDSHRRGELPAKELLRTYGLTGHLAKILIGWEFAEGTGPTWSHKLRYVANEFHYRRPELVQAAEDYVSDLMKKANEQRGSAK
jgi:hypothetical protein